MYKENSEILIQNFRFVWFLDSLIWYNKDWKLICELGNRSRRWIKYCCCWFAINEFLLDMLSDDVIISCEYWYQKVGHIKELSKKHWRANLVYIDQFKKNINDVYISN
jgi:hypothetical protein